MGMGGSWRGMELLGDNSTSGRAGLASSCSSLDVDPEGARTGMEWGVDGTHGGERDATDAETGKETKQAASRLCQPTACEMYLSVGD